VLTTENDEQALARAGGKHGNKGTEAAQVVMEMIGLISDLSLEGVKKPTKKTKKK
jgi:6,7-dimethyl-8-ribityllumazine synthase